MTDLIKLRKDLHRKPELSGNEETTASRIKTFIREHTKAKIIDQVGGFGLLAVFESGRKGPVIMIRSELDALAIAEKNSFDHVSVFKGLSHSCGHDGHMSIVAGLAKKLNANPPSKGKIILVFQPSEETGKGAEAVLNDSKFKAFKPDYIFALHNLPGYKKHQILVKKGQFTICVQSFSVKLFGKVSHAAQTHRGINPSCAIAEIISSLNKLSNPDQNSDKYALLTPVFISMGAKDYGISPGKGEMHYTVRTFSVESMVLLIKTIENSVKDTCKNQGLKYELETFEYFPSVYNQENCSELIKSAAKINELDLKILESPLKFGEDFGRFTSEIPGAMFALGSGINTPALHHADYDFPDEIIETGIKMFETIIKNIQNKQ